MSEIRELPLDIFRQLAEQERFLTHLSNSAENGLAQVHSTSLLRANSSYEVGAKLEGLSAVKGRLFFPIPKQ